MLFELDCGAPAFTCSDGVVDHLAFGVGAGCSTAGVLGPAQDAAVQWLVCEIRAFTQRYYVVDNQVIDAATAFAEW
jgi:hypothetical protein